MTIGVGIEGGLNRKIGAAGKSASLASKAPTSTMTQGAVTTGVGPMLGECGSQGIGEKLNAGLFLDAGLSRGKTVMCGTSGMGELVDPAMHAGLQGSDNRVSSGHLNS